MLSAIFPIQYYLLTLFPILIKHLRERKEKVLYFLEISIGIFISLMKIRINDGNWVTEIIRMIWF